MFYYIINIIQDNISYIIVQKIGDPHTPEKEQQEWLAIRCFLIDWTIIEQYWGFKFVFVFFSFIISNVTSLQCMNQIFFKIT